MSQTVRKYILKSIAAGRFYKKDVIKYASFIYGEYKTNKILDEMCNKKMIEFEKVKTWKYPKGRWMFKDSIGFRNNYRLDVSEEPFETAYEKMIKKHDNVEHALCIQYVRELLVRERYRPRESKRFKLHQKGRIALVPDLTITGYFIEVETGKSFFKDVLLRKFVKAVQFDDRDLVVVVANSYYKDKYHKLIRSIRDDYNIRTRCQDIEEEYMCKKRLVDELNRISVIEYSEVRSYFCKV